MQFLVVLSAPRLVAVGGGVQKVVRVEARLEHEIYLLLMVDMKRFFLLFNLSGKCSRST